MTKCCKHVRDSTMRGHTCRNEAKVERDGKWYCRAHDPVSCAERNKARNDKANEEFAYRMAKHARKQEEQNQMARKLANYDRVCAAAKALLDAMDSAPQITITKACIELAEAIK